MAAYAADSTTAMRDGADGLPAGSVLCLPNNATKWRVLNGSKANNGDDGIFVLSETASTDQVNLLKKIRRESDKNLCGELYTKLFSPTFETVIKKTTKTDALYNGGEYHTLKNILNGDTLFALSAEEADTYKDIIPVIELDWGLRSYNTSGLGQYAFVNTTGVRRDKTKSSPFFTYAVSVRPAFNLKKSKVMLFIPMSISGVSGTLSAVSASANEYRPLIAQEDRATFTAQTLQTDGKTATDASGTVTVTLPDGINPAFDTLYIFNEQHSTVSNAKTGLSSNMQKVCITHSFEASDQGDTNEHILKCSACGYQPSEAHDFTYVSDDNDATHTGTCRVCKKTVSGTHSLHIIGYDPGVHTKRCDICSYIANVLHNFIYTDNGNGTHTRACTLCGNSTVSAHSFAYVDRGNGISEYVCGDCGADSGIFSYNRSVIPDGCRDITKLVDKNSVATSVSTWGDG